MGAVPEAPPLPSAPAPPLPPGFNPAQALLAQVTAATVAPPPIPLVVAPPPPPPDIAGASKHNNATWGSNQGGAPVSGLVAMQREMLASVAGGVDPVMALAAEQQQLQWNLQNQQMLAAALPGHAATGEWANHLMQALHA